MACAAAVVEFMVLREPTDFERDDCVMAAEAIDTCHSMSEEVTAIVMGAAVTRQSRRPLTPRGGAATGSRPTQPKSSHRRSRDTLTRWPARSTLSRRHNAKSSARQAIPPTNPEMGSIEDSRPRTRPARSCARFVRNLANPREAM